ncbi:MAG: hypothetical protein U1F43_05470 [Myxococcota bacterium]
MSATGTGGVTALEHWQARVAEVPDAHMRSQLGAVGVSATLHLAPELARAATAALPPGVAVIAFAQAAAEHRAPASAEVAEQVAAGLRAWPRGWTDRELGLGLWAGMAEAEARVRELPLEFRWEPLRQCIEAGVPATAEDALAWAERIDVMPLGLDRCRIAYLRRRVARTHGRLGADEAAALGAMLEPIADPLLRLEGFFELAVATPAPGAAGRAWAEIAVTAGREPLDLLRDCEREMRVAAVLARAADAGANAAWERALAGFEKLAQAERWSLYGGFCRGAAASGAARLDGLLARLDGERQLRDEKQRLAIVEEAADALRYLEPEADCGAVFGALTREVRPRRPVRVDDMKVLASLVRAALRTGARPVDTWLADLADKLRAADKADLQPMTLARTARIIAAESPSTALGLERNLSAPFQRALWALGVLQAELDRPDA